VDIPQEHQEVLVAMGVAVLLLQTTERVIRLCMTLVLQKDQPLTLEKLQQQEESERNKTLGYFLSELRKRVDLDQHFDQLLKDFLKNRNDFIHNLNNVPAWGFRKHQNVLASREFVYQLIHQSENVTKVFAALISAWVEHNKLDVPVPDHEYFDEIETTFKPVVDRIFFAKDP